MRQSQGAEHALAEQLRGPVKGAIRMGMVPLRGGKRLGLAIDRGGRSVDELLHARLDRQTGEFKGGVHHRLDAEAGLLGAVGDPQSCLMEHNIGVRHEPAHQLRVADVAFQKRHFGARQRRRQILPASADEIVQRQDAAAILAGQTVDDVRADESGAARHQYSFTGQARQSNAPLGPLSAQ